MNASDLGVRFRGRVRPYSLGMTKSQTFEAHPTGAQRFLETRRLRSLLALLVAIGAGLLMVSIVVAGSSTHTFHATTEQLDLGDAGGGSVADTSAADGSYRVIAEEYVSGMASTMGDSPSGIAYASTSTNVINLTPYTMPVEGGFIYRVALYITATGQTQFRVALYGDTETQPRVLLAQSAPLTVTDVLTQPGWLWFDLTPQAVPGNARYWLAYQASNDNAQLGLKYSHPSSGYYYRTWTWGPFPDVVGTVWGPVSRRVLYQVAYTATRYALDVSYTVPVTSGMNAYTLTVRGATSGESFNVSADGQAAGAISYSPTTQHFLSDDMESGTGAWTANGFTLVATDAQHYSSATHAWWTDDVPYACMNFLTSAPITLPFSIRDAELRFWHRVVSEHNYDGGWIEYRAQDNSGTWSPWSDLTETAFIQGSYNATVSGTHPAWSGTLTDVVRTQVPATAAGHPVQWRWAFRCDPLGIEGPYQPDGWWIDDVHVFGTVSGNTEIQFPLPLSSTDDGQVTVRFQDTITNTYVDALGIDQIEVTGFQTNRPPTLTVTSPNGGEYWGGTRTVEWQGSDPNRDVITYSVYLSTDGGSTWSTSLYQVAYSEAEAPTTHTWNGFDTTAYADGTNYFIRVQASDGTASASDQSNAAFTIDNTDPSVALTAPNGGQLLRGGSSYTIMWSGSDANLSATPIALYYSTDGGASFPNLITAATENDGFYSWTIPALDSSSVRVRVVVTDRGGNSSQDDSDGDFTADSTNPTVSLSAPNGGEILQSGTNVTITWNASDAHLGATPIAIYYSTNGGSTFAYVIATATENDGSYAWTVPNLNNSSVRVRVMATDMVGHTNQDDSDGNFTIDMAAPSVTLTAPNGGELLRGGGSFTITWSATDTNFGSTPITLYYSTDGGTSFPNLIVAATENDGSHVWTVPTLENATARVRVVATDLAGISSQDASNANFSIDNTDPTVAITGPNGGEYLQGGHDATITWNAGDAHFGATPIALYYSTDGGTSFPNLIIAATANDGAYTWAVPALNNTSMRVRAVATDLVGHSSQDNSDANFTVDSTAPGVTLIAPNGGQIFYGGDSCQITWNASDAHFGATPIALYYSTDGGASFPNLIIAATENDGAHTWVVPALDSINVRVRVTAADLAGNSNQDDSDANFTVNSTSPNGTVTFAEGDYATSSTVHLTLNAPDDTTEMILDGDVADASNVRQWIAYSTTATVTLTTGEGSKTVTVVYRDAVGNEGDPASDTTIYDLTSPTMSNATPAAGSTVTTTNTPAISAILADTLSGINSTTITMTVDGALVTHVYNVSTGAISYTPVSGLANGAHAVAISARDRAGNPGAWNWSFTVDATRWVYLPFVVRVYTP